jgi:hypothetical protein
MSRAILAGLSVVTGAPPCAWQLLCSTHRVRKLSCCLQEPKPEPCHEHHESKVRRQGASAKVVRDSGIEGTPVFLLAYACPLSRYGTVRTARTCTCGSQGFAVRLTPCPFVARVNASRVQRGR